MVGPNFLRVWCLIKNKRVLSTTNSAAVLQSRQNRNILLEPQDFARPGAEIFVAAAVKKII
jgi:hypothetical protein